MRFIDQGGCQDLPEREQFLTLPLIMTLPLRRGCIRPVLAIGTHIFDEAVRGLLPVLAWTLDADWEWE